MARVPTLSDLRQRWDASMGGAARRRVILVYAAVLATASADTGALSAVVGRLQTAFTINSTDVGLLASVTAGVGALATVPFGRFVDRVDRTRLLTWSVVTWVVATILSSFAPNYDFLLATRTLLGAVTAVAYPAVASLIGDYFPPGERGRIYGYVLSGELVGTGAGVVLAGAASAIFDTWRAGFAILAVPAAILGFFLFRLPEPARGGASRMPPGQSHILSAERVEAGEHADHLDHPVLAGQQTDESQDLVREEVEQQHIAPHRDRVLRGDPSKMSLWQATLYVLRIRTNVIVIVASSLAYFVFNGAETFGIRLAQEYYHLKGVTTYVAVFIIGLVALLGVLVGGRFADALVRRGRINGRITVPSVTYLLTALFFAPGLLFASPILGVVFLSLGGFSFGASNPPLDASRLDVTPGRMWGRAEAIRTLLRGGLQAAAPVTVGALVDTVFKGTDAPLRNAFLVLLIPLLVSGGILFIAKVTYPRDVATADASDRSDREHPSRKAGRRSGSGTSPAGEQAPA